MICVRVLYDPCHVRGACELPTPVETEKRWMGQIVVAPEVRRSLLSIAMTLLKSKNQSIDIDSLLGEVRLAREELLEVITQLEEEKIIKKTRDDAGIVVPSGEERLKLAVKAVTFGAKIEESAQSLSWKEFESFCTKVLEENGYSCIHGFRFRSTRGRRYECDVLALSDPILLLADCKHYKGSVRGLHTVVEKQLVRANALGKSILTLMRRIPQILSWRETVIVPAIITLFPESIAIADNVPVVPAFKLNQFIQELPSNIERITHSTVKSSTQRRLV
jgi:predicted transcriptional regulator